MSDLYVYLIHSRNKDNKNIQNFKERTEKILEYKENEDEVIVEFKRFAENGLPGESTRLYRSVNSRNEDKVREDLVVRLIKDKPSITKLNNVLASVSQQIENRDESRWLFDFDVDDEELVSDFIDDIYFYSSIESHEIHKTPHGYAIVVQHGFDTRELMEKWKDYDITLKKDDLLFLDMIVNDTKV